VNFLTDVDLPASPYGMGFFDVTANTGDINFNTFNLTAQNTAVTLTAGNRINSSPGGGNITTNGGPIDAYAANGVTLGNLSTVAPMPSSGDTWVSVDAGLGSVVVGNVATNSSYYGDTHIDISAGGSVNAANLMSGASYGYDDGGYSGISVVAENGGAYVASIKSGLAAYSSSVYVIANSPDTIVVGDISTGPTTSGGAYDDSSVYLYDPIGAIIAGNISTGGSTNPSAASNAQVFIEAGAGVTTGNLSVATANEGDGVGIITSAGNITTGSIVTRGAFPGADAGDVYLSAPAGSVQVNGIIDTRGTDNPSGIGGDGGSVSIQAMNTVVVGPPPTFGTNTTVIDTSGGAGYMGGGHAGSVFVDPVAITFNGVILALGGAGGFGPGGDGGNLDLITSSGTVTFVNGGWDLTGGAGNGPGLNGSVNIVGTLIFAFVNDPLANTTVSQLVGQTIDQLLDVLEPVKAEEDEGETLSKKKPLASCRPG
jgi:hypothetical protein